MIETVTIESKWDRRQRKQAVYCRPHGRRIIIFLNGVGGCRKCIDLAIVELQRKAEHEDRT